MGCDCTPTFSEARGTVEYVPRTLENGERTLFAASRSGAGYASQPLARERLVKGWVKWRTPLRNGKVSQILVEDKTVFLRYSHTSVSLSWLVLVSRLLSNCPAPAQALTDRASRGMSLMSGFKSKQQDKSTTKVRKDS